MSTNICVTDFFTTGKNGTGEPLEYHYDDSIGVDVDSAYSTVTIRDAGAYDDENRQDDIFLQGREAEEFIAEVQDLMVQAPDMPEDVAELIVATPYAENLWN